MTDLITENARLRAALVDLRRGVAMIHDALATPSRPRQSVGEVAAWWLNYADAALATLAPDARPVVIGLDFSQQGDTHIEAYIKDGRWQETKRVNAPDPDAVQEAARGRLLEKALKVAMGYLAPQQPDDSSAVDDWFLACAAVQAELDDTDGRIEAYLDAAIRARGEGQPQEKGE